MHVWIVAIFMIFFVLSVTYFFKERNPPLHSAAATLTMDPPITHVMETALETAMTDNDTKYIKHTRKGCKMYVPFTTISVPLTLPEHVQAINACEKENLTGKSGYRCVGAVFYDNKWNSCIEIMLQRNAGTWLNADKSAAVSYFSRQVGSEGGRFTLRPDLGCKRMAPWTGVTDEKGAINACDKFATSEVNGACLGVVNINGWQRCLELQPDHDTTVWVKDTPATTVTY